MTSADNEWNEARIGALLGRFFAEELPTQPPPPGLPPAVTAAALPPARTPRPAAGVLAIATACLLLAAAGLGLRPGDVPSIASAPAPLEYYVIERDTPLERISYETASGPVEQRTQLHLTSYSVYEPETGDRVEWTLPEISIEVVALGGAAR